MLFSIIMNIVCATPNITTGELVVHKITRCIDHERRALLELKEGMTDYDGVLASWGTSTDDCCKWRRVGCSNRTGHVIKLQLRGNCLSFTPESKCFGGVINFSFLGLSHLKVLDLSNNNFTEITQSIGSLVNLQYLNFRNNYHNVFYPHNVVVIDNLKWLSNLSSLKYLDLSGLNLIKVTHWFDEISPLFPSLVQLKMSWCFLPHINYTSTRASLSFDQGTDNFNLSKSRLAVLDLSLNNLNASSIYPWLLSNNFSSRSSLVRIDLGYNNLQGTIPEAFVAFPLLEHLDLSRTTLEGGIPRSFGNLSHLRSLDLSCNHLDAQLPLVFTNLSGCTRNSLEILNLEDNGFSGSLPDFTSFSSLQELHLSTNQLDGSFPGHFGETSKLTILDVSENQITGSLPDLSAFSDSLREFALKGNRLTGSLPESIGQLSKLEVLLASKNFFQGAVTESLLKNLSRLLHLDLSFNNLSWGLSSNWTPPFRLNYLGLSSIILGPSLPEWIRTQNSLYYLDISNAGISGVAPNWIWDLTPTLYHLNLSSNRIEGMIPNLSFMSSKFNFVIDTYTLSTTLYDIFVAFLQTSTIDLSSNNFSGKIPHLPSNTAWLDLSNNNFSGPISFLCSLTQQTLNYLDLSNNHLSEKIPDCLTNSKYLQYLNLENNKLTGIIPESMGSLIEVGVLNMRNNNLIGELPSSLRNCVRLQLLDLRENKLIGEIPEWIGESMSCLSVLSLGTNSFHGTMPLSFCRLPLLQILDLSVNKISGTIPKCLKNLSAMGEIGSEDSTISGGNDIYTYMNLIRHQTMEYAGVGYVLETILLWKGRQYEYKNTLGLVKILDLSSNNFSGEIPDEITSLVGLVALNLSRNNITGSIPPNIGDLELLDFLDLSRNQLCGKIPESLSQINRLSMLDVSYNNLSERIPAGTQLQGYNASVYMGNPSLCGPPLTKKCPGSGGEATDPNDRVNDADDEEQLITREFYIGLVFGFGFGFLGVFGTMLLRGSWRFWGVGVSIVALCF